MENELLPCPFCGGEAEILTAESMHGGYLFGIMCNDCRSRGDVYDTEAEAIAAWNTRAERTCHMSFIDEYETASGEEEYLCECSECGHRQWEPAHDLSFFCSKCGAKVVD